MNDPSFYTLTKGNIYILPILHHTMEFAWQVHLACRRLQPDCIAVELPQSLQTVMCQAAERLPAVSIIAVEDQADSKPWYYLAQPCDPAFEGLRYAIEKEGVTPYCIDLDLTNYPLVQEHLPDPYSITSVGLKPYFQAYQNFAPQIRQPEDDQREMHMARRLKELALRHDKVLVITGMAHAMRLFHLIDQNRFDLISTASTVDAHLYHLTDTSCREVLPEFGWICAEYEKKRQQTDLEPLDRHQLIHQLYCNAGVLYSHQTGHLFETQQLRCTLKFARNCALIEQRLLPDLYQILTAAKGCVDSNYAYAVWELATEYPYQRNIDHLPEINLTAEQLWGHSKRINFHLKQKSRKGHSFLQRKKHQMEQIHYHPPSPFTICSHPPEDAVIENFADYLKKKGKQLVTEEASQTAPFQSSIEEGIDLRETLRHWQQRQIYVKLKGPPFGGSGNVVVIFDEDSPQQQQRGKEFELKYPWCTTWIGEHNQESDMAFYATNLRKNIVGPGISRCEYGGFMMSYPPRRLGNIWHDSDYAECKTKAEVLLMAAIDYSRLPHIVYVAKLPARAFFKSFAARFGKKIVYIPLNQLSPAMLNKLRIFHVLDGHHRRDSADEYIF